MKKIVSCTIATALAATNLPTMSVEAMNSTTKVDDSVNVNINENNNDSESKESLNEDDEQASEESTISSDDKSENSDIEGSVSAEAEKVTNIEEIDVNEKEIENKATNYAQVKKYGKLEFDINFAMPIINTDSIYINLFNENQKIGQISDLSIEEGTLDNGSTYKIEKLNSKKQPLEDGDNAIYFVHITVEKLELGTYSAEIKSESYIDTTVDNIEIKDFSKRVILGNSNNEALKYNGVFLAGDVNGDGKIDMGDYNLVFENIGSSNSKYDINKDGKVDVADLTYVNSNIGLTKGSVEIVNTDAILEVDKINIDDSNLKLEAGTDIRDILVDNDKSVTMTKADGKAPTEESPLSIGIDLSAGSNEAVVMEKIVLKAPENSSNADAALPEAGTVTYEDENGNIETISFGGIAVAAFRSTDSGDLVIDLGKQVAVKQITINVTGNRGNKNISEIAKIEFLNNVYKEVPKPDMNIPEIKTLETSTNLHDERITISWEAQPNVTSYEVTYQKLNENGQVVSTKKLQTNETNLNILDKDIKPYDLYRVSIQSLNGDWSSGYLTENDVPSAFDGKADNVDSNFNPIESYYNGDKGSVSEIQVVPIQSPEPPRNLTTEQGYKSFTVSWEQHSQARDFDIYYRKVGDTNKNWIKANEDRIEVTEDSQQVVNRDKS